MKKMIPLFLLACLCVSFSTGCFRTSFSYKSKNPGTVTEDTQKFLAWGLVGPNEPFRADQLCPSGVAGVETYATFGNGCIGKCTLGIYAPRTIKVTCSAGGAHNFYLDENDNVLAHETVSEDGESTVEDFTSQTL